VKVDAGSRDLAAAALQWRAEGRRAALATVVSTWGSSPCPAGSQLLVDDRLRFIGSVSGGCVESAVMQAAQTVMQNGAPQTLEFGIADDQAWAVGLACGGRIRVLVEAVAAAVDTLQTLAAAVQSRTPAVRVVDLAGGAQHCFYPAADGDSQLAPAVARAARDAAVKDRSTVVADGGAEWFLHVLNPPPTMVVAGAVHIAQFLAPLALALRYRVTVVDPRAAFAAKERFAEGVAVEAAWPAEAAAFRTVDARTAVVALTHDPKVDDPALQLVLASAAFYIGALGSRKTHAARCRRLAAAGATEAQLARIHAPVGLAINAATPGEIALAVMAQVTAELRRGR